MKIIKNIICLIVVCITSSVVLADLSYTQNFDGVGLQLGDCGWTSTAVVVTPQTLLQATTGEGGTASFRTAANVWAPSVEPINSITAGTDVLFGDIEANFGGTGVFISYWVRSENGATERLYLEFKGAASTWSKEVFAPGTDMTVAKNVSVNLVYAGSNGWVQKDGTESFSDAVANITAWNLWSVDSAVVPGYSFNPAQIGTGLLVDSIKFTTMIEKSEPNPSDIFNSCETLADFNLPVYDAGYSQEGGIAVGAGPYGQDCIEIVSRTYNDHTLVWNVEADVVPSDRFYFNIKNVFNNAVVLLKIYHDGLSTPYQPEFVTDSIVYPTGWQLFSVPMTSDIEHIDRIEFGINQSNLIVQFANFHITQSAYASCEGIHLAGYGYSGDLDGNCHVDMNDMSILAQGWLDCTSPDSAGCINNGYTQTGTIVRGTATVDANLSEWSNQSEWVLANQVYFGDAQDANNVKFAMRWDAGTNKIYAAVVVTDTQHVFVDFVDNTSYDASDRIEIYSQGSAAGGAYNGAFCDAAQQYIVAHGVSIGTVWASWPGGYPLMGNPAPGLEYACKVVGNDIIYELGIPMYDNYAGRPGSSGSTIVTQLHTDSIVGLDIVIDSRWGINASDFGMLAANSDTGKFNNASAFAKYKLVEQTPCGAWGYASGDIDENCVVNFKDFAELAEQWLLCNNPLDNNCIPNWQ